MTELTDAELLAQADKARAGGFASEAEVADLVNRIQSDKAQLATDEAKLVADQAPPSIVYLADPDLR